MIIGSISLSSVILCLAPDRFESAFVTIRSDDFQIPILPGTCQYHSSFEPCDLRLIAIIIWNIPLSQHVERNPCCTNTFAVFNHVFQVTKRDISLRHAKNSVFGKIEG